MDLGHTRMNCLGRRLLPVVLLAVAESYELARGVCRAEVRPAACFGSHMVLQRECPLPVWGAAAAGERVVVTFGAATGTATADAAGAWRVTLPAQAASVTPRRLLIRGGNEVVCDDVLVGDVWLCAGQSNMLLPLAKCDDAKRVIAAAAEPRLRLLQLQTIATGDRPAYTTAQVKRLVPAGFCTGTWQPCTPETARGFSAVGYLMGRRLATVLHVPVGVVCVAVGGSPTEAWIRREALAADPAVAPLVHGDWIRNPALAGWCVDRATANLARARRAGEPVPGDALGPNHPFKPGFLWEAGIAPLVPLAIRGVAWYQGESNADSPARVAQHARLFPALVRDWRRQWGRDDLPFVFVQLPGMNRPDWPAFRETQRRALAELPHAGMVVTIDLGQKNEVHPGDKQPVGERIAGWALAEVHGRKDVDAIGPLPTKTEFEDATVVIRFDHAAAGLRTRDGEPPRHFAVAGEDGAFHPATARIDGACVVVVPPAATRPPRYVRYAWAPFPEPAVNLVNAVGLPVSPFQLARDAPPGDSPSARPASP
jgi:sialate O-acetylesterase